MFVPYGHLNQKSAVAANSVALLPLAAMETHGSHLPLATDGIIADAIVERTSEMLPDDVPVYVLPLMWLGASTEHADRSGTLSTEPEQLISQICSIGGGLERRGIKRLLLFNAHGGNVAAGDIAILKLRDQFDMLVANAHWLNFGLPESLTPPAPAEEDIHGGWVETSILLHVAPELVNQESSVSNLPTAPALSLFPKGPVNWGWKIDDLAPGGWIGRPDLASAKIGEQLVEHAAKGLCATLVELTVASWPPAN